MRTDYKSKVEMQRARQEMEKLDQRDQQVTRNMRTLNDQNEDSE